MLNIEKHISTPNGVFHLIPLLTLWCLFDDCFMTQRANVYRKYIKQVVFPVKGKPFRQGKNLGAVKTEAVALLLQMLGLAASFLFQGKSIVLSSKVLI